MREKIERAENKRVLLEEKFSLICKEIEIAEIRKEELSSYTDSKSEKKYYSLEDKIYKLEDKQYSINNKIEEIENKLIELRAEQRKEERKERAELKEPKISYNVEIYSDIRGNSVESFSSTIERDIFLITLSIDNFYLFDNIEIRGLKYRDNIKLRALLSNEEIIRALNSLSLRGNNSYKIKNKYFKKNIEEK